MSKLKDRKLDCNIQVVLSIKDTSHLLSMQELKDLYDEISKLIFGVPHNPNFVPYDKDKFRPFEWSSSTYGPVKEAK